MVPAALQPSPVGNGAPHGDVETATNDVILDQQSTLVPRQ